METYDALTASHYAAWRPPLHKRILTLGLESEENFFHGLDIGCGTGRSAHALKRYCHEVIGIDPSSAMISRASASDGVRFVAQTEYEGFNSGSFDIFSFAGSLYYQDAAKVFAEISRLATAGATVVVYDFDVHLGDVFDAFDRMVSPGNYDHQRNFSGLEASGLEEVRRIQETMGFSCSAGELAHLLLSVPDWRQGVFFGLDQPELAGELSNKFGSQLMLEANVYLTRYAF